MRKSIRLLLVVFALVGSAFALSGIAGAQDDSSKGYVLSETASRNADLSSSPASANAAAAGASAEAAAAAPASLAFTGSDVLVLSVIGGVAIVAGAAILVARRRIVQA